MTESTAPNSEQRRAWDGPEGDTWTDNEDVYNEAVGRHTRRLLDGAALAAGERILDVGCGCGETTRLAGRNTGAALGIDLSSRMIARARERAAAEGLANVRFEQGDAQVHPFEPDAHDVAISRCGTMFFDDPVAAFANIATAIEPGGRLAMLCWRELRRNEWVTEVRRTLAAGRDLPEPPPGVPSPFALADPDRARTILTAAGFDAVEFEAVDEPMYLGADASAAFDRMRRLGVVRGLLEDLDETTRAAALAALRASVHEHETPDGVLLGSSAWLVRARRAG